MTDRAKRRRLAGAATAALLAGAGWLPAGFARGGALDGAAIDKVIHRNLPKIQRCYQDELDKKPGLKGKIVVAFTIDPDGTVPSATVDSSTVADPDLEECICRTFEGLTFPAHRGDPLSTHYPVTFEPSGK